MDRSRGIRRLGLAVLLAGCAAGARVRAEDPGPFRCVLPRDPSPVAVLAAAELRDFLDRVFPPGAAATQAIEPVTFYIGPEAPAPEGAFAPPAFQPGEFEVAVRGRAVRLAGYDGA